MADLKEDLAVISSTVVAGVGAFLSWFYQSGLLGTITGIAIGAGITYFVDQRTQKRVWKREYAVKITEQVYGELFGEIKTITSALESDHLRQIVLLGKWANIQNDHRYFMVDRRFRELVDDFYKSIEKYNSYNYIIESKIIPNILRKQAEVNLNASTRTSPQMILSYLLDSQRVDNLVSVEANLRELKSLEEIEADYLRGLEQTKVTHKQFIIKVAKITPAMPVTISFGAPKAPLYWQACLDSLKTDSVFASMPSQRINLLKQAVEIKSSLEKRISEPWNI